MVNYCVGLYLLWGERAIVLTHTQTHTRRPAHTRTHAHTHAHAHTHTCTHTHAHAHTRTHMHTHARPHTRTCTHTHAHAYTRMPTHTRAHTHAHARTHMHTTIRWTLDMAKARVACISTICPTTPGSKFAPLLSGYAETASNLPDNTNLIYLIYRFGARGGTVGWGTVLQAGRSRVRFPTVSLEFLIDINLPAALWPWGWFSL